MKRLRIKPELESPEISVTDGPYNRTFYAKDGAVDFSTDARVYEHEQRLYLHHDYIEIFDDVDTPTPTLTPTPAISQNGEEDKGDEAPQVAPQVAQPKELRKRN